MRSQSTQKEGSLPGISHGLPLTGTTDVTLTLNGLLFLSMVFCSCLLSLWVSSFFFLYSPQEEIPTMLPSNDRSGIRAPRQKLEYRKIRS